MNPVLIGRIAWSAVSLAGLWLVKGIAGETKEGVKSFNNGFATNALVVAGLVGGIYLLTRKAKA